ncbi:hypothetical protein SDC9_174312 [bioreactor metagenome]|uniref:Uncharacterized protein n=1 Tax=bioreactor metagenome TaxID=1076179 RepID=A0A645GKZ2_9ZZZZ
MKVIEQVNFTSLNKNGYIVEDNLRNAFGKAFRYRLKMVRYFVKSQTL